MSHCFVMFVCRWSSHISSARNSAASDQLQPLQQLTQPQPVLEQQSAFRRVEVGANDHKAVGFSVLEDAPGLVFGRILLMFCGHAQVLRSRNRNRIGHESSFKKALRPKLKKL